MTPQPRMTCYTGNVPARLQGVPNWVLWRAVWNAKTKRWDKIPVNPRTASNASSDDPNSWADFRTTVAAALRLKRGIGFMVTPETKLVFGDLDHCINADTGQLTPEAADIIALVNTYSEISPGGDGLRFILEGTKPGILCKRGSVELYDQKHMLTITGAHLPGTPTRIEARQAELDQLYAQVFGEKERRHARAASHATGNGHHLTDQDLLERAFRAKNGEKLRRLLDGNINGYPSASEADSAAAFLLAFWTQDFEQILRIIHASRLDREKWHRDDYAERTIGAALAGVRETYSGKGNNVDHVNDVPEPPPSGCTLADVVAIFQRWLYMPDPTVLYAVLGAVAANLLPGDPVWLLTVGPPGSGKTETINALSRLQNVHHISTLTEAALLSGTPKKEKASDAKGGLLRVIGAFGIIVAKDFTSVLSMHPDSRRGLLAGLREIYDGHWDRGVGTDGGRLLTWDGKVGFIAGCTPTIDSHHGVMATMGERFIFCRLPVINPTEQAMRALAHVGRETEMREELAEALPASSRRSPCRPRCSPSPARRHAASLPWRAWPCAAAAPSIGTATDARSS